MLGFIKIYINHSDHFTISGNTILRNKGQNKPYNDIFFNGGQTVIFHKAIWNTEKCA